MLHTRFTHDDQCRCGPCVETAINEIVIKYRGERVYSALQQTARRAYAELDASRLSNFEKDQAWKLGVAWLVRWLGKTIPLDGEAFGAKINNIT